MERMLGLDVGTKTIGVAVSDPLGYTAQPMTVIRRRNKARDLAELRHLVEVYNAERFVVGYPLSMSGAPGPQAAYVSAFVEDLKALGLPIELVDERLTTKQAEQVLLLGGLRREKRREVIDQQAAALILQTYMDREARRRARSESPPEHP
jgi:putative Holliday junction resolvase